MTDQPATVLIVDDHAMVAEGLTELLAADPDLEVVGQAGTGRDAERLAGELRPRVIVMDYRLPDADGAAVTRRIRERHPETAVVMVTASDHDTVIAAAIEAGCVGYVTKDSATREVVAAVRAAARGEVTFPAWALAAMVPHLRAPEAGERSLTPREGDVLGLLVAGRSTADIAETLEVSATTVREHLRNIRAKLGATTNHEAAAIAVRQGLIR